LSLKSLIVNCFHNIADFEAKGSNDEQGKTENDKDNISASHFP